MHNFKDLKVWKSGIELAKVVFKNTRNFPNEERYGLTSQLNRCAVSIPSNIAEGCGRESKKELFRFLGISLGSAFELETQIILAFEFGYLDQLYYDTIILKINEIQKMIAGLQKSLNIQS